VEQSQQTGFLLACFLQSACFHCATSAILYISLSGNGDERKNTDLLKLRDMLIVHINIHKKKPSKVMVLAILDNVLVEAGTGEGDTESDVEYDDLF
jgi:hypothetical protein